MMWVWDMRLPSTPSNVAAPRFVGHEITSEAATAKDAASVATRRRRPQVPGPNRVTSSTATTTKNRFCIRINAPDDAQEPGFAGCARNCHILAGASAAPNDVL